MATNKKQLSDIEWWNVGDLVPYEKNAKIHTDKQIEQLANVIKKQGFKRPITIDENGVIIAGHGRRLAAIKLKLKTIPCFVERGLSEEEKAAQRISDNMVARGEYDNDILGEEIASLVNDHNFGAVDFGMFDFEISDILSTLSNEPFEMPEEADPIEPTQPSAPSHPKEVEYKRTYFITIECESESMQRKVHDSLNEMGVEHKLSVM